MFRSFYFHLLAFEFSLFFKLPCSRYYANKSWFLFIIFWYVWFEQGCRQMSKSWLPWDPINLPKLIALLSPYLPTRWSLFWHFQASACFPQRLTTVLVSICCDKRGNMICFLLFLCLNCFGFSVVSGMWEDNWLSTPSELHRLANL